MPCPERVVYVDDNARLLAVFAGGAPEMTSSDSTESGGSGGENFALAGLYRADHQPKTSSPRDRHSWKRPI